jgi:hypothetical protein
MTLSCSIVLAPSSHDAHEAEWIFGWQPLARIHRGEVLLVHLDGLFQKNHLIVRKVEMQAVRTVSDECRRQLI